MIALKRVRKGFLENIHEMFELVSIHKWQILVFGKARASFQPQA
jgi:hypothetical protein